MTVPILNHFADYSAKKRALLSFLLGGYAVFGLAPLYWWPIYLVCFGVFSLFLYTAPDKKSLFWSGWSFGFGYFVFGLYWISLALHVDWATWWWLTPFAAIGLPIYLSLYYGLAALCMRWIKDDRILFPLALAIYFSVAEYLRGILFTGFPWNLPSYIWVDSPLGQNLSWLGAYGLNVFVYMVGALGAFAVFGKRYVTSAIVILALLYGFGLYRTSGSDQMAMSNKTIMIVQPNIPQIEKWDRGLEMEHFKKTIALTGSKQSNNVDFILWPETAITYRKGDIPSLAPYFKHIIGNDHLLLTGVTDIQATNRDLEFSVYNSLVAVDNNVKIPFQYNKHHLVPFGEYVPFRKYLNFGGVAQALSNTGDFKAGPGPQTLQLQYDYSVSPLICYEVIFPGRVIDKEKRPDLLVNITNDGWYLNSTGPHQHLAMSRARAIETGIPLARAANTGISALISPYGETMLSLPLQSDGTIISSIPKPLPETIFSKLGNFIFLLLVLTIIALMLIVSEQVISPIKRRKTVA